MKRAIQITSCSFFISFIMQAQQTNPMQSPQFGTFQQVTTTNPNPSPAYIPNSSSGGFNANDINGQIISNRNKAMGYNPPPRQEQIRAGNYYDAIALEKEKNKKELYNEINSSKYDAVTKKNPEQMKSLRLADHNTADYISYAKYYSSAYKELNAMLDGTIPLNLKRAVFTVENAYYNNTKNYDQFCKKIDNLVFISKQVLKQEGLKANNSLSCHYAIQKLFSDTIVYTDINGNKKTFFPLLYDFDDYWGEKDYSKMFVSKLLNTGTGQCHSLPLLYLLIASELKTEAYLCFAPNHTYIKYPVGRTLFSFECTNGRQVSDSWMVSCGYISTFAIQNKIYLNPLTTKETIAECLVDLSSGYWYKFGYDDFNIQCAQTALKYYPNSISALMTIDNVGIATCANTAKKYHFPPYSEYQKYPDLKQQFDYINKLDEQIANIGYMKPSKEEYANWLATANEEKQKRESERLKKEVNTTIQTEK